MVTESFDMTQVEIGGTYKLDSNGLALGQLFYPEVCVPDGTPDFIVSGVEKIAGKAVVYTDKGIVCNPEAKFIPVVKEQPILARVQGAERAYLTSEGGDPEVFVTNAAGDVVPAWTFLPKQVKEDSAPQRFWDGFQAEFTFKQQPCHAHVVDAIQNGLFDILVAATTKVPDAKLLPTSVVEIPYKVMQAASAEEAALVCAPSVNAYGTPPFFTASPKHLPIRFAGFHIHTSSIYLTDVLAKGEEQANAIIRALDETVGLLSVSMMGELDDVRRRQFYGRAGEYRLPKYGLEYRTLSGSVLKHPVLCHLALDIFRIGLGIGLAGVTNLWGVDQNKIQAIVDERDYEAARVLLNSNKDVFDTILNKAYPINKNNAAKIILNGAEATLGPLLEDTHKAWQIHKDGNTYRSNWSLHSDNENCQVTKLVLPS